MNLNKGGLTNNRALHVTWDKAQNSIVEPASFQRRMSKTSIFPSSQTNLIQLASGIRVLKPENDLSILHESATAHQYIIRLADWEHSPVCVEKPRQRVLTELLDITPGADVATSGDWFIHRAIEAGGTWDRPLTPVEPGPPNGPWNYPLDPIAITPTTGIHESNQGYLIRILIPNSLGHTPDVIFSFRFGGEIHGLGYGKFEAFLTGDGHITLYEKVGASWETRGNWQFTPYREMAASLITLRIIPHWPRFIEFRAFAGQGIDGGIQNLSDSSLEQNLIQSADHTMLDSRAFEAKRPAAVANIGDTAFLRPITGPGRIMVSVRRDLRLAFQVAKIAYRATGTLTDRPFVIAAGVEASKVVRLRVIGYEPVGAAAITGSVETSAGGALIAQNETFTLNGSSTTYSGWQPLGGSNKLRAVITLTNSQSAGSRWQTPSFEGYEVQRHVTQGTYSTGEKTGGGVQTLFITGPSYRPDHESAALVIEDPKNELSSVRNRRTPVRIETTYDPLDQTKRACLFDGWTERVTAALLGKHGRTFPRETHHRLDCDLTGQWERLSNNRFTHQFINLADQSSHPLGRGGNAKIAWKVTDAIWWLLYSSGFAATQLDIPDDPIRFPISKNDSSEDTLLIRPGTANIGLIAAEFARFYLNQYLIWDGGAGATGQGMWRLKRPPTASSSPIWTFTLDEVPAGKLAHLSASYGSRISPVLDADGAEFRTVTEKPEANLVQVIGRTQVLPTGGRHIFWNQMINFRSWFAPGRESLGNPDHIDWLGDVMPVQIIDDTLPTQAAVDFVCRRIFEASCFGRVFHTFAAELVLANVSASETFHAAPYTHRPLLPGDCVNLVKMDGSTTKCVLHSASYMIDERKEYNQLGHYEIEEFEPNRTIGGLS